MSMPAKPITITGRQAAAGGAAVALLAVAGFVGHLVAQPSAPLTPNCAVKAGASAATIQTAVNACTTVSLAAGTYALTNHITVNHAETISGAGPTLTHLIQHARVNIFQVNVAGVTIENMDVNTAQFNPGVPPVLKDPVPGTIFSGKSHTSILNLDSEAGTGFGFRLTGPNPCQSQQISGDVIQNVSSTNTGGGGFTAMDFDCMSSGTITNVVIHGDYIALYESSNVTVNGLTYFEGPYEQGKCGVDVYVTGPAVNDLIENVVTHNGGVHSGGISHGPITNLRVVNETRIGGCTNGL